MIINCHFYLLQLKTLYHIGNLTQLRYLNISKCANVKDITELQSCSCLQSLNLSGLKLSPDAFSVLEGKEYYSMALWYLIISCVQIRLICRLNDCPVPENLTFL